jgi:hypothetical protein
MALRRIDTHISRERQIDGDRVFDFRLSYNAAR